MTARRKVRTAVRVAAVGGVLAGGAWWLGAADNSAHASTNRPGLAAQVVQEARNEYGLPATKATCWATGPATFSCWVSGPGNFKAVAIGEVIDGTARAVFS